MGLKQAPNEWAQMGPSKFMGANLVQDYAAVAEQVVVASLVRRWWNEDLQLGFADRAAMRGGTPRILIPVAKDAQEFHRFVGIPIADVLADPVQIPTDGLGADLWTIDVVQ